MTLGEFLDRFEYMDRAQQVRFHAVNKHNMTEILSVYESPDGTTIEVDLGDSS